jgi:hypothetical protein
MDTFSKLLSDKIYREMNHLFKNIPRRLRIWSDIDKFNWKEDTGEKPKYYQYLWPDTQGDMYLGTYNAA